MSAGGCGSTERSTTTFDPARRVDATWFQADVDVLSFTPEEMLASKVAAVYGRRKPRDLFDIWAGLEAGLVTPAGVADRFVRYRPETWTARLVANNLKEKLARSEYLSGLRGDLDLLGRPYDLSDVLRSAAALVDACTEATQPQRRWRRVVTSNSTAADLLEGWSPPEESETSTGGESRRFAAPKPAAAPRAALRPQIVAVLKSRPDQTYAEIAAALGASASYVAQVARQEDLTRSGRRTRRQGPTPRRRR